MMTHTVSSSIIEIRKALPINLASRTLAYKNANNSTQQNDATCEAYLLAAGVADPTTICANYDFTNITDV